MKNPKLEILNLRHPKKMKQHWPRKMIITTWCRPSGPPSGHLRGISVDHFCVLQCSCEESTWTTFVCSSTAV